VGRKNARLILDCPVEDWKCVRSILTDVVGTKGKQHMFHLSPLSAPAWRDAGAENADYAKELTNLQKSTQRVFNLALREIRMGAFCEVIDRREKYNSAGRSLLPYQTSSLAHHDNDVPRGDVYRSHYKGWN